MDLFISAQVSGLKAVVPHREPLHFTTVFHFICAHLLFLCLTAQQFSLWGNKRRVEPWSLRRRHINSELCKCRVNASLYIIFFFSVCQISRDCCKSPEEERVVEKIRVWYQKMYALKPQCWTHTQRKATEERTEKQELLFFRCFIFFDDSRKKQKYRFIFLFFLNGWRSLQNEGIRNEKSTRIKDSINETRQRERRREGETEREIKGESELHNQRTNRKALPTAETPLPPSH